MNAIAQAVADGIRAKAGGKIYITENHPEHGIHCVDWRYDCPCGEVSGYSVLLDTERDSNKRDPSMFVRYHIDMALECMRRHVRGEGNEPSF